MGLAKHHQRESNPVTGVPVWLPSLVAYQRPLRVTVLPSLGRPLGPQPALSLIGRLVRLIFIRWGFRLVHSDQSTCGVIP